MTLTDMLSCFLPLSQASRYWRPMPIDYSVVDVKTLREYTKPMDVVDLLAKITRQLRYVLGQ